MKQKIDIKKLEQIYIISFFIYLILGRVTFIAYLKSGIIDTVLSMIFAGVGCIFVLINIFFVRKNWKNKYVVLLFLFMIFQAISCLLFYQYGFLDNVKTMVWMSIQFFVLYTYSIVFGESDSKKLMIICLNILAIIYFILVSISILEYIFQIGFYMPENRVADSIIKRQGFVDNRLFGVFEDPNFSSLASLIVLFFSVYSWKYTVQKKLKVFYMSSAILQYVYIILSGSRTSLICLLAGVLAALFIYLVNGLRKESICKKICKITISCVFVCIVFFGLSFSSRFVLEKVPEILHTNGLFTVEVDKELLKRKDVGNDNVFNNRTVIWSEYLSCMNSKNIWLGITPRGGKEYVIENELSEYIMEYPYTTHSDYVGLIVYSGIVGTCIMAYILLSFVIRLFKYIFTDRLKDDFSIMMVSIVAAMMLFSMFFLDMHFSNTMDALLFWLTFGFLQNVVLKKV